MECTYGHEDRHHMDTLCRSAVLLCNLHRDLSGVSMTLALALILAAGLSLRRLWPGWGTGN